jgi:triacylglycerol lipase
MSGQRSQLGGIAKSLADQGYTAVAISYRLAPDHKFPAQLEDCRDAVLWMRREAQRYQIDPRRIGGFGYSAGGHLVALLATSQSRPVEDKQEKAELSREARQPAELGAQLQAVVAGGAPCDFRLLPKDNRALAYWLGGSRGELPEVYREASPASFICEKCPPIFFFHGEKDTIVPLLSPRLMHQSLLTVGVSSELYQVAETSHFGAIRDQQATDKAVAFLDSVLKKPNVKPGPGAAPTGGPEELPADPPSSPDR